MQVPVEVLAAFFVILQFFCVETNRWPFVEQVVGGPLLCGWLEERVSNEILVVAVGGGALIKPRRGRTVHKKSRVFDSTKGFPGEDVA